uniref:Uncharacterized protein n=1 Tax=Cajanus cajan TaxID=3821 RepID=A0A151TQI6_CAJCA|nr:hypothetical protein KK1_008511 [Cajanus cajan]
MAEQTKFHPALAENNVKNFISITLEMDKGHYSSWVELFKIHCRAYQVLDHIIPPKSKPTEQETQTNAETDKALWSRLDAIVLNLGPFTNSMLKMHSYMVNLMKLSTCTNRWVFEILSIQSMCAY